MTDILDPEDCATMAEVRAGVDDVDRQVVALLKRRFGYMDAALSKVDATAAEAGIDRSLMARLYEELIECSIAHEYVEFDRTRANGS